jgi:hypothetical protein
MDLTDTDPLITVKVTIPGPEGESASAVVRKFKTIQSKLDKNEIHITVHLHSCSLPPMLILPCLDHG